MKYTDIILDIDGTIWNTTEVVAKGWNLAIEKFLGENSSETEKIKKVTADMLKKEFGKPMDVIARDLWPDTTEENRAKLLEKAVVEEHKAISQCKEDLAFPAAIETIKNLAQGSGKSGKKCNFYIVSNCQKGYVELVLEKNGIAPFIKDFETFGATGLSKGENIKLVAKRNNLKNCAYVGDTKGDEEACKEAKIDFIWASYGFGQCENYAGKLQSFSELENFIF